MITYNRQREYGAGCHVNPEDWNIDHRDEPASMMENLIAAGVIPVSIICAGPSMEICFSSVLTPGQEATMDQVIEAHKAVADWPPVEVP